MDLLTILLIAVALALDCFAVSLAAGTTVAAGKIRAALIMAIVFGLFQAGMTVTGWAAGIFLSVFIASFDHWIAFLILSIIGIHMIHEGIGSDTNGMKDYLSPMILLFLAVATSLDSLGVGLSFAILSNPILLPAFIIGFVSSLFSFTGLMIGSRITERFGRHVEIAGGIVLILIGIRILVGQLS
jgi:putative Mn2+ efflux pump MntP